MNGAHHEKTFHGIPILVTGGCGFIGSHLAEYLTNCGAHVTILDNLSTGSLDNIAAISDNVNLIIGSITDPELCFNATAGKKIVFHLAAFTSVPLSLENPSLCHQVNVDGTFHLLEAARLNNVNQFILSSSAAVYGSSCGHCKEDMPCNPESPYGFTKLMAELYCKQYALNYGLNTVCLRYFNVYGERQNPRGPYASVFSKFRDLMKQNLPITIYGDGSQTRDFISVEEVVEANIRTMLLPHMSMQGTAFNIGTGNSRSILSIIDMLKKEFPDYSERIIFAPARAGDIEHSSADCSKYLHMLRTNLGFEYR
jgi:UDP-glucose 4-epimerase